MFFFSSLASLAPYLYDNVIRVVAKLKTYMYVCYNLSTFTDGTLMFAYPF